MVRSAATLLLGLREFALLVPAHIGKGFVLLDAENRRLLQGHSLSNRREPYLRDRRVASCRPTTRSWMPILPKAI